MQTSQNTDDPSATDTPPEFPSRVCAVFHAVLGAALAQLVGCVTTPAVRPDPVGFLDRCPPEARATPTRLGLKPPYFFATYLLSVTPVSSRPEDSIEKLGAINFKPGPVTVHMYPLHRPPTDEEKEHYFVLSGEAVTTRMRAYLQFNRIQLPDGTWLPICGVAVSDMENGGDVYGLPTREALEWPGKRVDPALVDHSPGSVVLYSPRFGTAIEPPEGEPRYKARQVDPNARSESQ